MGDFGALGELPTVEDVQERCNKRFDELFHYDKKGERHPYVCCYVMSLYCVPKNAIFIQYRN